MKSRIEDLYNELIETKKEFLEEVESEICLIGEMLSSKKNNIQSKKDSGITDVQTKMKLINICEQYINDIDIEMELIASYMELEEKVKELKHTIDVEISQDLYYKKHYEDLANSKLGRIQRFWWRKSKKS